MLGTIIRDTQIRATKNAKKHTNHNHQGLGRKFRLARPPRASDASSDSPDLVQARAPDPLHLGNKTSPDMTDATAPITQQGKATTVSTTPVTAALPLSLYILTPVHCSTLPHSRKGMGEVKRHHCLWSFPTIDRICSSDR